MAHLPPLPCPAPTGTFLPKDTPTALKDLRKAEVKKMQVGRRCGGAGARDDPSVCAHHSHSTGHERLLCSA